MTVSGEPTSARKKKFYGQDSVLMHVDQDSTSTGQNAWRAQISAQDALGQRLMIVWSAKMDLNLTLDTYVLSVATSRGNMVRQALVA